MTIVMEESHLTDLSIWISRDRKLLESMSDDEFYERLAEILRTPGAFTKPTFRAVWREFTTKKGYKDVDALAALIGISESNMRAIERGDQMPSTHLLFLLEDVLGEWVNPILRKSPAREKMANRPKGKGRGNPPTENVN